VLVVDSLEHAYGDNRVLSGIYARVEPGEVVGIVGRNGCGKTTMLRALLGTLVPDHMHLTVDGELVRNAYRSGVIAYLPQEPYLPRRMRVRRAVSLALPHRHEREAVSNHAGLAGLHRRRLSVLSGGERRILEVLIAINFPARYVLLDEPFTEVEPMHRRPLGALIRRTAERCARGVIVTDHAYRNVLATADRVFVMADGVLRSAAGEDDLRRWGYTP